MEHGQADHRREEVWLTAAECARRTGLTVRALRLYEAHGLIAPRRTGKDWRLYGRAEIARLNEVLTLKSFGLSLSRIADLLKGKPVDLGGLLDLQHDTLRETADRAERGLRAIAAARAKLAAGGTLDIDELTRLARETAVHEAEKETLAWRRYEQARPRTEIAIDPALLDDYAGAFELVDGPYYIVIPRDGRLVLRLARDVEFELFPEAPDAFFMKDIAAQVSFGRDATGAVASLVFSIHGTDTPGHRADPQAAALAAAALDERIRLQAPMPDSEATLRELIEGEVTGRPLYERMAPFLAAIAREQVERNQNFFGKAGELRTVTFRGVTSRGQDVYDVAFDGLHTEWGFSRANNGKINGLYIRPTIAPVKG